MGDCVCGEKLLSAWPSRAGRWTGTLNCQASATTPETSPRRALQWRCPATDGRTQIHSRGPGEGGRRRGLRARPGGAGALAHSGGRPGGPWPPLSANWFSHPAREMTVLGVTGTNGKTTTTYLLKAMLEGALESGWGSSAPIRI